VSSIPVLTLTPSMGFQHSLTREFLQNSFEDGYFLEGTAEDLVLRADGVKSTSSYSGLNEFTLKYDKMTSGTGKVADQLWTFFRARLDNLNEPFYLYNPTEKFPPDSVGASTRGRYLVQLKDPSAGLSRSYFRSCLFNSGVVLKEVRKFGAELAAEAASYPITYVNRVTIPGTLELFGNGVSNDALIFQDGYLYGGTLTPGTIFRVDPDTMLVEKSTTFADASISGFHQLIYYNGLIYALISISGYIGKWIQKISLPAVGSSDAFTLVGPPLYAGTVCYGTDGKAYGSRTEGISYAYIDDAYYRPPIGGGWTSVWELLPDSYSYHVDVRTYYDTGVTATSHHGAGAKIINFRIIPDVGYIFNGGPSSSIIITFPVVNCFDFNGNKIIGYGTSNTIGPNEIVQNPNNAYQFVTLRDISISATLNFRYGGATTGLRVTDAGSPTLSYDVEVLGLLDNNGNPNTDSTIHHRTIWHPTNGRIYSLHSNHVNTFASIIAVDVAGTLLYQYTFAGIPNRCSFVIFGDFIYIWQDVVTSVGHSSSIIKLNLNLEYLLSFNCVGDYYTSLYQECGRHIVSDGINCLYNFSWVNGVDTPTNTCSINKYKVAP
jgi:hypothetical protein